MKIRDDIEALFGSLDRKPKPPTDGRAPHYSRTVLQFLDATNSKGESEVEVRAPVALDARAHARN